MQVVSLVQSSREAANASDATLAASTEPANGYERRHILYGRVAIVRLAGLPQHKRDGRKGGNKGDPAHH